MIQGMTGYGTVSFRWKDARLSVEVRSQNHRYLDVVLHTPYGFGVLDAVMRDVIAKHLKRGRIQVVVRYSQKPTPRIVLKEKAVEQYLRQAERLKRRFNWQETLTLSELIALPGVVETEEASEDLQAMQPALKRALGRAVSQVMRMRRREGQALSQDLKQNLKKMHQSVRRIQGRWREVLRRKKKELAKEEFSSYQKTVDIHEELVRLSHYIMEFRKLLRSRDSVGKTLDFVAQEMQRETNTIGSKFQDTIVGTQVVRLKSIIEKIREQVQNIE